MTTDQWEFDDGYRTQCLLRQGQATQVAWISRDFAVVGRQVQIETQGIWEVVEVYQTDKVLPGTSIVEMDRG